MISIDLAAVVVVECKVGRYGMSAIIYVGCVLAENCNLALMQVVTSYAVDMCVIDVSGRFPS